MIFNVQYLDMLGRCKGKTYSLCEAAKSINATVVCATKSEADRVKRVHGVKTATITDNLHGMTGPYLIDVNAASVYASHMEKELDEANNKIRDLSKRLYLIESAVKGEAYLD